MNVTHELETNEHGDLHDTVTYRDWRLTRHGETVLWGTGIAFFDIVDAGPEGYRVEVGETAAWDTFSRDLYVLLTPGAVDADGAYDVAPGTVVGMAMGDVNRKMIPAASPDVTALEAVVFEDVEPLEDTET